MNNPIGRGQMSFDYKKKIVRNSIPVERKRIIILQGVYGTIAFQIQSLLLLIVGFGILWDIDQGNGSNVLGLIIHGIVILICLILYILSVIFNIQKKRAASIRAFILSIIFFLISICVILLPLLLYFLGFSE